MADDSIPSLCYDQVRSRPADMGGMQEIDSWLPGGWRLPTRQRGFAAFKLLSRGDVIMGCWRFGARRRSEPLPRLLLVAAWVAVGGMMVVGADAWAAPVPQIPAPPPLPVWAQSQKPPPKKALVIGIDKYKIANQLSTPVFDASLVASGLKKLDPGFEVKSVPAEHKDRKGLLEAFDAFGASLSEGDIAFIYFSGHGVERNGINYLVPEDAQPAEAGREGFVYISVDYLSDLLEKTRAGMVVLILDACRTDPFAGGGAQAEEMLDPPQNLKEEGEQAEQHETVAAAAPAGGNAIQPVAGLKGLDLPQGFIAVYAAAPGKPSFSLFKGDPPSAGSIFTRRLMGFVSTINKSIDAVFNVTAGDVFALTKKRQKPFISAFNGGEILLQANANLADDEFETWARAANSAPDQLLAQLTMFVSLYPAGPYTAAARAKIQELSAGTSVAANFPVVKPQSPVVLGGALRSAPVQAGRSASAIAQQNVFVRANPYAGTGAISSLRAGDNVQVVDGAARPGWAKVLLRNGAIGYVGSVQVQTTALPRATLSVTVPGNDAAAASVAVDDAWREAAKSSTLVINVNPAVEANPWRARQKAFLSALQLRDTVAADGVQPSRLTFTIGRALGAMGQTSMSIFRGGIQ